MSAFERPRASVLGRNDIGLFMRKAGMAS